MDGYEWKNRNDGIKAFVRYTIFWAAAAAAAGARNTTGLSNKHVDIRENTALGAVGLTSLL